MAIAPTFWYFTRPLPKSSRPEKSLRGILWQQNLKRKAPPLRSQSRRPLQKLLSLTRPSFRISHPTNQKKMKST